MFIEALTENAGDHFTQDRTQQVRLYELIVKAVRPASKGPADVVLFVRWSRDGFQPVRKLRIKMKEK